MEFSTAERYTTQYLADELAGGAAAVACTREEGVR
jgi:hypothetical protein